MLEREFEPAFGDVPGRHQAALAFLVVEIGHAIVGPHQIVRSVDLAPVPKNRHWGHLDAFENGISVLRCEVSSWPTQVEARKPKARAHMFGCGQGTLSDEVLKQVADVSLCKRPPKQLDAKLVVLHLPIGQDLDPEVLDRVEEDGPAPCRDLHEADKFSKHRRVVLDDTTGTLSDGSDSPGNPKSRVVPNCLGLAERMIRPRTAFAVGMRLRALAQSVGSPTSTAEVAVHDDTNVSLRLLQFPAMDTRAEGQVSRRPCAGAVWGLLRPPCFPSRGHGQDFGPCLKIVMQLLTSRRTG